MALTERMVGVPMVSQCFPIAEERAFVGMSHVWIPSAKSVNSFFGAAIELGSPAAGAEARRYSGY